MKSDDIMMSEFCSSVISFPSDICVVKKTSDQIISTDVQVAQLCFQSCTALCLKLRSSQPVSKPIPNMLRERMVGTCQVYKTSDLLFHTASHSNS